MAISWKKSAIIRTGTMIKIGMIKCYFKIVNTVRKEYKKKTFDWNNICKSKEKTFIIRDVPGTPIEI